MQKDMSERNVLVSICVQTYQHKNYIKECLDSLLNQRVDFEIEIVLGEDESDDGTREICEEYAQEFPQIRLIKRKREDMISIDGRPSGRYNYIKNLETTTGAYVAICEGDDYWMDPDRLQKQVDFLERNPQYIAVTGDTRYIRNGELGGKYSETKFSWLKRKLKNDLSYFDMATHLFPHTSTWVFRNSFDLPVDFRKYHVGDVPLFMLLSSQGKVGYIDEVFSAYRIHDGGITSHLNEVQFQIRMKNTLWMYESIDQYLKFKKTQDTSRAIVGILGTGVMDYPQLKNLLFGWKSLLHSNRFGLGSKVACCLVLLRKYLKGKIFMFRVQFLKTKGAS
jgi:glycosyltransferase involved in cell wall biosynthesis